MTILVSDLGETVINKFKQGTFRLADFTVLPKTGVWHEFVEGQPWLLDWLQRRREKQEAKRRLEEGFGIGPEPEPEPPTPTIDELAKDKLSNAELARRLPDAIRRTAETMRSDPTRRYNYEEWVEFTRLIRFSARSEEDRETDDPDDGLIEWDWIGEDSPMMATVGEPEFVLARLCESMNRYVKQVTLAAEKAGFEKPPDPRPDGDEDDDGDRETSGGLDDVGPSNEKAFEEEVKLQDFSSTPSSRRSQKGVQD